MIFTYSTFLKIVIISQKRNTGEGKIFKPYRFVALCYLTPGFDALLIIIHRPNTLLL
jgi:hypothetical protein